jgi:hypothetical protein
MMEVWEAAGPWASRLARVRMLASEEGDMEVARVAVRRAAVKPGSHSSLDTTAPSSYT